MHVKRAPLGGMPPRNIWLFISSKTDSGVNFCFIMPLGGSGGMPPPEVFISSKTDYICLCPFLHE